MNLLRLLHTVWHLRPEQLWFRVYYRIVPLRVARHGLPNRRARPRGNWVEPVTYPTSFDGYDAFTFLNEKRSLSSGGWNDPAASMLWRYNLHYFDFLLSSGSAPASARAMIDRWIIDNPPLALPGWEPYPTSRRIVNWIKWLCAGNDGPPTMIASLALQARALAARPEYHLLGNHLFANAKALIFAGLFFGREEAMLWLADGLRILTRELPEQILADGGHFELSPMYHAAFFEDVLDLINIMRCFGSADLEPTTRLLEAAVGEMTEWLAVMTHPDGHPAFFNDTATDVAPTAGVLGAYAARLGFAAITPPAGATDLAASGYYRIARGDATLIADVAHIGPDYLPGHAHADSLSFELSIKDQRIIVNGGTSVYGTGAERLRQRGTPAHNTVCVDGRNSSDVWSGFRVGQRARIVTRAITISDASDVIEGAHDGYIRQSIAGAHHRRWDLREHQLVVEDRIDRGRRPAVANFLFHPDLVIEQTSPDARSGRADGPSGVDLFWEVEHGSATIEVSTYHPMFGVAVPTKLLAVALKDNCSRVRFVWPATGSGVAVR